MMRVAIMGGGGTGGYYGALLARTGQDVSLVARGPHLEAIRKQGLEIKSIHGDLHFKPRVATDEPREIGPVDLVLFCTKTYDTDAAAGAAKGLVGPDTVVLSLQNGVDAVERIGSVLGLEHLLAGATWISSAVESPGVVRQVSDFRRLVFGELDGRRTPRAEDILEAFRLTGVAVELSSTIPKVLWTKFVFISAVSALGSITRLPLAAYRAIPEARALLQGLMLEVVAVASASGVALEPDIIETSMVFIDQAGPTIKASMQLDVETGHRSELESLVGIVGRKGRQLGVPTPLADFCYACLLPLEVRAVQRSLHREAS